MLLPVILLIIKAPTSMIKIPAKSGQVCVRNKTQGSISSGNSSDAVYVYATSAGEVEVQCLKF